MLDPIEALPIEACAVQFQQHERQRMLFVGREPMAAESDLERNPAAQEDGGLAEGGVLS